MPPVDKAKAAGISASSFFDLKAELSKKEAEFSKNKAAGKANAVVGGVKRDNKKLSQWAKANAGVQARATRDIDLGEISKPTMESARAILERKAKVYDKLRKGKSGGLDDKQYDALLVDFEQKGIDPYFESDSDDEDESATVPVGPQDDENDPIVEYEDEFGRARTGRRSEIPRHLLPQTDKEKEEDFDPYVIYNPVNHFPTYEPSQERVEQIRAEYAEENNPLNVHYDASAEVRAKGAGFYQFSGDEETRKRQMEDSRKIREETTRNRAELGAVDVRPGDVEGMHPSEEASTATTKSRAMEKRKRELEERRRLLEAKRRKVGGKEDPVAAKLPPPPKSEGATPAAASVPTSDPFAALEALSGNTKGKSKMVEPAFNAADDFLAQLEQDIMKGKAS
ncbi:Coiled-coil domain-containing protein 174 [Trametes pubescens]|uniref:Coiled-coil domain-containing protein 174 n=1 Tax=Trametes pubescens TaxID=154538 RepID=A0A1M2W621_TRAPU|nr:Coiled-coil domain-containing protein 174 [Trametes pubescens]